MYRSIYLSNRPSYKLRISHFNAQSVANCPEKRTAINQFILDNDVDILFLTETWLKPQGDSSKCADLAPVGYVVRSFPRASRGGGIAVVFRENLSHYFSSSDSFEFEHPSFEAVHVTLSLPLKRLNLFCIYRPPPSKKNKLTDSMFFDEFTDLMDFSNTLSGGTVIVGDMNVHFDRPDCHDH